MSRDLLSGLADQLDMLRTQLEQGTEGGLESFRNQLVAFQDQSTFPDDHEQSRALGRLSALVEVWECLNDDQTRAADLWGFLDEGLARWAAETRGGTTQDTARWILQDSNRRWGDYLQWVDPNWEQDVPIKEDAPVEEPQAEPVIDASELLSLLTGAKPTDQPESPRTETPPPRPTSAPPESGLEAEGEPDAEPAIDVSTLLNLLTGNAGKPKPTTPTASPRPSSQPQPNDDEIELGPELREAFLADASELFERIQELVLELGEADDTARLGELGRCYHTLKGAAGSVGLSSLATAIHELEDRLEEAGDIASPELTRRLEESLEQIERVLKNLHLGTSAKSERADSESRAGTNGNGRAGALPSNCDGPDEGPLRVASSQIEELLDLASELITRRRFWIDQAEQMKAFAATTRACSYRLKANIERMYEPPPRSTSARGARGVSWSLEDLDRAACRLTEQAEDLTVLAENAQTAALPLTDEAEALARISQRFWDLLQSIRVVPVRGLFQRLTRVAREAARVEGRQVEVVQVGEESGLDRATQDHAYEPLLHVVRNAVGHGIEALEDRTRLGKPPVGRLTLEAMHEGNAVVLSVRDDGRGLDYEAIVAKGQRLGLLEPNEQPSIEQLNALVFSAGFSTRQEANAISGRGVGMDVVAQEVARLRGTIALDSQAGQGTRLAIRLPARLALTQAMVVRVGGGAYAMPVEAIEAVQAGTAPGSAPAADTFSLDRSLPVLDACKILGDVASNCNSCPTFLIVRARGERAAVRVEVVVGILELVVKPLGSLLAGHPVIAGTSITTTGEVVLVLDPGGLIRLARGDGPAIVPSTRARPRPERPKALVVDDSISVRLVSARHLRDLGFEVDEAADGEQALRAIRTATYRLVLTDLEMPQMDGFELLAELRRLGTLRTLPVVVASTRGDDATRRRVAELGARGFVAKPVEADDLANAVRPFLVPSMTDQAPDPSTLAMSAR